jgi:hypothetical protein
VAAAHPGELAAGAKADHASTTLTIRGRHGRVRYNRPGLLMFVASASQLRKPAGDGWTGLPYHRDLPARELDEGIAVVQQCALRRRTAVIDKVRVLTS